MDQLGLEKKGIPTVTIATSAFEKLARSTMQKQGVADMALVVVPHPIAGLSADGVNRKADAAFPDILKAATEWQPSDK